MEHVTPQCPGQRSNHWPGQESPFFLWLQFSPLTLVTPGCPPGATPGMVPLCKILEHVFYQQRRAKYTFWKPVTKYCDKVLKEKLSQFFLTLGDFILLQMSFCPFSGLPFLNAMVLSGDTAGRDSFRCFLSDFFESSVFFTVFREIIFTK